MAARLRLLAFVTSLLVLGAFAARFDGVAHKDPCEAQPHVYACAIFQGPGAAVGSGRPTVEMLASSDEPAS